MELLDLYHIDMKYVRNLSHKDDHIYSVSPQRDKQSRPFVGIVVMLNEKNYCIPLTSPKEKFLHKKSQLDFIKIFDSKEKNKDGSFKLIGVLNINNMIPVNDHVITKINLSITSKDNNESRKYKELMQKQIKWCRRNVEVIINRARKVYEIVTQTPDKNRNLTKRCLDFTSLEDVLENYQNNSQQDLIIV